MVVMAMLLDLGVNPFPAVKRGGRTVRVDRPESRNRQGLPPPVPPSISERAMFGNKKPRINKDGAVFYAPRLPGCQTRAGVVFASEDTVAQWFLVDNRLPTGE